MKLEKVDAIRKALILNDKTIGNPKFIELTNLRDFFYSK